MSNSDARLSAESTSLTFQKRVVNWLMACFSMEVCRDGIERNHRFLEEALELVQSLECTRSEAHQLVDYVFNRPVGEPQQELGGTLVTLTALANCHDMDMMAAGETELARVWTKIDKIRAKQAAKPKHSPLPEHVPDVAQAAGDAPYYHAWLELIDFCNKLKEENYQLRTASHPPAAPVETQRRYTEKEVSETVEKVIREMLERGEIADTRSVPRSSAARETVIGADGKSRPITLRQIVARAALSVIEKPDGVETLDWQIADAVLTVLPAIEPQGAPMPDGWLCELNLDDGTNWEERFSRTPPPATSYRRNIRPMYFAARPQAATVETPSAEAMKAAVELEIHAALGRVQTVEIGRMIQKAIEASRPQCSAGRATAWLIEWPQDDNNPARWWNPAHGWMRDANKALWFARQADADCYLSTMRGFGVHLKATEHIFIAGEPQLSADSADVREALLDVKSHRENWRGALLKLQTPFGSDDDGSYWAHELRAFDRTFAALEKIVLTDLPQGASKP